MARQQHSHDPPGRLARIDGTPEHDEMTTPERDDTAVRLFVEHMAMSLAGYGFPRMPARVLTALMAAEEPAMTAGEIGQLLGISPAAVSHAVRYLMQLGMVLREPVPGSRRDRYRLPDDPWWEVATTKGHAYKVLSDLAQDGVDALGGPATKAGARVAEMRDFFVFVMGEMDGLRARWLASRSGEHRP